MKLYRLSAAGLSLRNALSTFLCIAGAEGGFALCAAPDRYVVARVDGDGELRDHTATAVDLQAVYEARVVCPSIELRWLNDRSGGRAALISERDLGPDKDTTWTVLDATEARARAAVRYVVWGTPDGPGDEDHTPAAGGWCRLMAARIGELYVPVPVGAGTGQRVALEAIEYVARGPHGNRYVLDERLTRFAAITREMMAGG